MTSTNTSKSSPNPKKLALILSGGGARGAYEAGVLHYMRTELPEAARKRVFNIYSGASVGAINACFLAATCDDFTYQGTQIFQLWKQLDQNKIYHRDLRAAIRTFGQLGMHAANNLFRGFSPKKQDFAGLLDTAPLPQLLNSAIDFSAINRNLKAKHLDALVLASTNIASGATELFLNHNDSINYSGAYTSHAHPITAEHAMASAAIPVIFPPVFLHNTPYVDGGLRLNTPLSPAIQLGAESLLIINLHHNSKGFMVPLTQHSTATRASLGQILGRVINTIFLDHVEADIEQLQRLNQLVDWSEEVFGDDYLERLNESIYKKAQALSTPSDIAKRGLKKIEALVIQPSYDLGLLFNECYHRTRSKPEFSLGERLLVRLLDLDPDTGFDFLSYMAFMPSYIQALLELGFEDARSQRHALTQFMLAE